MPTPCPLFQEVFQRIRTTATPQQLPYAACVRLALLVTGLLAARFTVSPSASGPIARSASSRKRSRSKPRAAGCCRMGVAGARPEASSSPS